MNRKRNIQHWQLVFHIECVEYIVSIVFIAKLPENKIRKYEILKAIYFHEFNEITALYAHTHNFDDNRIKLLRAKTTKKHVAYIFRNDANLPHKIAIKVPMNLIQLDWRENKNERHHEQQQQQQRRYEV